MCQLLSSVFIKLTSSSTLREKSPNTDFFFWPVYSRIWTEYEKISTPEKAPYLDIFCAVVFLRTVNMSFESIFKRKVFWESSDYMGQKAEFSVTLSIYLRIHLVKVKKPTVFNKFVYIHERNPYQVSFLWCRYKMLETFSDVTMHSFTIEKLWYELNSNSIRNP